MLYEEVVKYLESLPQFIPAKPEFTYGLDRARFMLDRLGRPDRGLKVIHVAGTNGKGSACAYLDALFRSAGVLCGLFTSPHLICIRERIVFDGKMISEADFVRYFDIISAELKRIKETDPDFDIAYFEFLFLMSVLFFRDNNAQMCIYETGLGGRLDAVNVFETTVMSVITQIGLDHTAILGNTLEAIAREKCGIIKPGVPVVCIEPEEESVRHIFTDTAKDNNSDITFVSGEEITVVSLNSENVDFLLKNRYYRNVNVSLRTPALFAAEDAALALTAFAVICKSDRVMEVKIEPSDHVKALAFVVREGRMEQIRPGIFADGAHNPQAIEAFTKSLKNMTAEGKNLLLFSAVKDKNYDEMVRILCESRLFDLFAVCTLDNDRGAQAENIKDVFGKYTDRHVEVFSDTDTAFHYAVNTKGDADRLFCVGSLYLAAEVKRLVSSPRRDRIGDTV